MLDANAFRNVQGTSEGNERSTHGTAAAIQFAVSVQCNYLHMAYHSCTSILHFVVSMLVRVPAVLKVKGGTARYWRVITYKQTTGCNVVIIISWLFFVSCCSLPGVIVYTCFYLLSGQC